MGVVFTTPWAVSEEKKKRKTTTTNRTNRPAADPTTILSAPQYPPSPLLHPPTAIPQHPKTLRPLEQTVLFLPRLARLLRPGNNMSVCLERKIERRRGKEREGGREGEKKQAVELYMFLMEGDTVGALRINLDAWMESQSGEKMANIAAAQ